MRTNRQVRPLLLAALLLLVYSASGCQILFRPLTPTSTPDEFFEDWVGQGSPDLEPNAHYIISLVGFRFRNQEGTETRHWHDNQQYHEALRRLGAWVTAFDGIANAASAYVWLGLWVYSPPLARSTRLHWRSQSRTMEWLRRIPFA
ncbi:MAG: hypothetical protein IPN34_13730 [Planctomycetes bacterium]|nr:hypothetical protein [Planctomycetota bacterium]